MSVDPPDSACSLLPSSGKFECEKTFRDYEISLTTCVGEVDLQGNVIRLVDGVVCNYSDFECTDNRHGEFYWKAVDENDDDCDQHSFRAVFSGRFSIVTSTVSLSNFEVKYAEAKREDKRLAVRLMDKVSICGLNAYATEHSDLFLLLSENGQFEERELRENDELFYNETTAEKRCKLETSAFLDRMRVLSADPNRFTEDFQPGVIATVSRDTVHVSQCKSITVRPRVVQERYKEIAVIDRSGREWFLTPDSKILVNSANPLEYKSVIMKLLTATFERVEAFNMWATIIGTFAQFLWGFAVLYRISKFVLRIIFRILPNSAESSPRGVSR